MIPFERRSPARTGGWLAFLAAAALAGACGCAAPEESGDPAPASPAERFRALLDLEKEGKPLEAIAEYRKMAADPQVAERDRVRAWMRIARCREDRQETSEARRAYESILAIEHLIADEETLPWPGCLPIHFRLEAEHGLERIHADAILFYAGMAEGGAEAQRLAAVRSLGRLKDARARPALGRIAADEKAPAELREAAAAALKRIP
jgi:hypothetical protein